MTGKRWNVDVVKVGTTWQNIRSGKLVKVSRLDIALDEVTVRYVGGVTRSMSVDQLVTAFRHESEITRKSR